MIDIVYDREKLKLTVKGHAKSAEAGKDLVCAAASILVYTLAGNVQQLCSNKRNVRRPVIDMKEGDATVSCSPVHGMTAITTLIFDTVCAGFEILAQQYPDNISYTVRG